MKQFLKMTLAAACGVLLVSIVSSIIAFSVFAGLLALGSSKPSLPKEGVLRIDLSKVSIAEQTTENSTFDLSMISPQMSETPASIGILDAIRTLEIAANDPAIKCVLLKTDGDVSSFAGAEEFRNALSEFRTTSGKAVVSYIESPSTKSYWIASVADKVYMTKYLGATTMVNGISSQNFFFGDLLKALKVNVQLIRHGKFKSAGEMFTRSSSSPENKLQNQRMVDALWEVLSGDIAQSRGISVEALNKAIDDLELNIPEDFVRCGLVDELFSSDDLSAKMAVLSGMSERNIHYIDFSDYSSVKLASDISLSSQKIAIIYADGQILDGSAKQEVTGDRFAAIISKVRNDDNVKAVVLRVNSPGGSVLASEKIKFELDELGKVKPLIASYGDYAASGGYWISSNCSKIYSDATTLTGSIGVFSIIPDLSSTAKDLLHIGVEMTNSNKHGNLYNLTTNFDKEETAYLQHSVEVIYDRFTSIVAQGRSMTKEEVDNIGQGRVWVGTDALSIGLVDEIGGLQEAVNYASSLVGEGALDIVAYPKPQTEFEKILSLLDKSPEENILVKTLGSLQAPQVWARMDSNFVVR